MIAPNFVARKFNKVFFSKCSLSLEQVRQWNYKADYGQQKQKTKNKSCCEQNLIFVLMTSI